MTTVNNDEGIISSMPYSIPSIAEQLLLLPEDSACSTPTTSSISSALSFTTTNNHSDGNGERLFIPSTETCIPKFEEKTNNDEFAINSVYVCESTIWNFTSNCWTNHLIVAKYKNVLQHIYFNLNIQCDISAKVHMKYFPILHTFVLRF